MGAIRGVHIWLAGKSPRRVAWRLFVTGAVVSSFVGYLGVGVALVGDIPAGPAAAWELVRLASSSLAGQAGWVVPTCLALILSGFASVYAVGFAAEGSAERRERDTAVHSAQVVSVFSVVFAIGVCVGVHDITKELAPAILVLVASSGCVWLAAVLTKFYVGDSQARIVAMRKLISARCGQRQALASYATSGRRQFVRAALVNIGVPLVVCAVIINLVDQPLAGRLQTTAATAVAILAAGVLAVVSMWPVADDGWGRGWAYVQHLMMSCVALSVPATVVWFLIRFTAEIPSNGAIPMWLRAVINLGTAVVGLVFVSIAVSAVVPWHRTRLARLAPWTLWGVAAGLGVGSLNRTIRSLEDDLAEASGVQAGDDVAFVAH